VLSQGILFVVYDDGITGMTRQPGIGEGKSNDATAYDR